MAHHLAVDVGGTTIDIAAYASRDYQEPLDYKSFGTQQVDKDTATQEEKDRAFALDFDNLDRLVKEMSDRTPESIVVIAAGPVNDERSHLIGAGNIVHWQDKPAISLLQTRYDCPVVLGNDAEGTAYAETLYGYGQGQDFLLAIWGTGINLCPVRWIDSVPFVFPAEAGHQLVGLDADSGSPCGCGHRNCLEAWCGGGNIAKRHGGAENVTPDEWRRYGRIMAHGVFNSVVNNPVPLVVFCGGVACKQEWLLDYIQSNLRDELSIVGVPDVKLSAFGESAGTLGAFALGNRLLGRHQVPVS